MQSTSSRYSSQQLSGMSHNYPLSSYQGDEQRSYQAFNQSTNQGQGIYNPFNYTQFNQSFNQAQAQHMSQSVNHSNRHSGNYSYPVQQSNNHTTSQSIDQSIQKASTSILESMNTGFGMINPNHQYPPFNQTINQLMNQSMVQPHAMNQSVEPRRSRHIKTNHAMRLLKQSFVENSKPSKDAMRSMTRSTGCTYAEICRWFRNERHKAKKAKVNYQSIKQSNKSNKGSLSQQSIDQATKRSTELSSADDLVNLIESGSSSTPSSPSSRTTTISPNMSGMDNINNQSFLGQLMTQSMNQSANQSFKGQHSVQHDSIGVAEWISTFHSNLDFDHLNKM